MQANGLPRPAYYENGNNDGLTPNALNFGFPSPSNYGAASDSEAPSPQYTNGVQYVNGGSAPPPDALLQGYKNEIGSARFQDSARARPRSSVMLNINDPVAMHLLVETAIDDSSDFQILSFDEVEALKKEQEILATRIPAVVKKLAIENKMRDAAKSFDRLNGTRGSRSSNGSSRLRRQDSAGSQSEDVASLQQKCDALSRELWQLQQRDARVRERLLRHTAGILQMTHNGPSKRSQGISLPDGLTQGARPDSPASIDTYENGRTKTRSRPITQSFDERSLYRSPDNLDGLMELLKTGAGNHMPADVLAGPGVQGEKIASVAMRLESLNDRLRGLLIEANPPRNQQYAPPAAPPKDNVSPDQCVAALDEQLDYLDRGLKKVSAEQRSVEARLEAVNNQIAEVINYSSQRYGGDQYPPPPQSNGSQTQEQLTYADDAMYTVSQIHQQMEGSLQELEDQAKELENRRGNDSESAQQYETVLTGLWSIILSGEEEARSRKKQRRAMLAQNPELAEEAADLSPDEPESPAREEFSLQAFSGKVQFIYSKATNLKEQQTILRRQIRQQRKLNNKSDAEKEEEFERLRQQIAQAREQQALAENELMDAREAYDELQAEVAHSRSNNSEKDEQFAALQAQMSQSRESQKVLEMDLQEAQTEREALEQELQTILEKHAASESQVQELRNEAARSNTDSEALKQERSARAQAEERLADLEAQIQDLQDDSRIAAAELQAQLAETSAHVEILKSEKAAAESKTQEANSAFEAKDAELRELEGEVVRLQTDLTIARAELDGAYGSRAQRAAEVAANPEIKAEIEELSLRNVSLNEELAALRSERDTLARTAEDATSREQQLREELEGTIKEFEEMARESVEFEKERERFEAWIDALREEKERVEGALSDEKVRWLGMKSPGAQQPQGSETTTSRVLRQEFKKMIRETRAEGYKALKAETEERRKAEALVRQLKREQGNGRSGLSQSISAS